MDRAVGRIQQTLVNLQIDTTKQNPLPLADFLTMYHPLLKFNKPQSDETKEVKNAVPEWKQSMMAMKAWSSGSAARAARGG